MGRTYGCAIWPNTYAVLGRGATQKRASAKDLPVALSINRVTLVGRLGRDPEIRQTGNGVSVANLSVATTMRWTDKSGARQERTSWHRCVAWDKLADLAQQILHTGSLCFLEGELMYHEYTDKQGIKRMQAQVRVEQIVALDSAKDREAFGQGGRVKAEPVSVRDEPWRTEDDMPF